ncbi:hypothetical protein UY3_16637 [Chelonia mydas]|uniref:Uncharacterized protein n=1 Tax=Chelonia mydas TaxID=8469 RepID=M7ATK9_CHEMY|nr:hypothetical protein UY3_16637 [Chelonia mydas]
MDNDPGTSASYPAALGNARVKGDEPPSPALQRDATVSNTPIKAALLAAVFQSVRIPALACCPRLRDGKSAKAPKAPDTSVMGQRSNSGQEQGLWLRKRQTGSLRRASRSPPDSTNRDNDPLQTTPPPQSRSHNPGEHPGVELCWKTDLTCFLQALGHQVLLLGLPAARRVPVGRGPGHQLPEDRVSAILCTDTLAL